MTDKLYEYIGETLINRKAIEYKITPAETMKKSL